MALNVWIIDDDLVSQFATEYSIQQSGHELNVRSFDLASDSLKNLIACIEVAERIPDIILLDLVMPEMNGLEFLDQVENLAGIQSKIKIFIISSFSKSNDRELVKNHALVEGYFDKPLSKLSVAEIFHSINVRDS